MSMLIHSSIDKQVSALIIEKLISRFPTLEYTESNYWRINDEKSISFKPKRKEVPLIIEFLENKIRIIQYSNYWNRRLNLKDKGIFGSIVSTIVRDALDDQSDIAQPLKPLTEYSIPIEIILLETDMRKCIMCKSEYEISVDDPDDFCSTQCKQEFRRSQK